MKTDLLISFIQSPLHWENISANLEMFGRKIASVTEPSDLILLPEMFSTGFTMNSAKFAEKMNGKTMEWMAARAQQNKCVIAGSAIIEEDGHYFNRFLWMRPDGTCFTYDKRHLFRMANEHTHYSSGKHKTIVELHGWNLCPQICYDLRFPIWSRNKPIPGSSRQEGSNTQNITWEYDVLIYVANWPEARSSAWKALLPARAIENQCYVAGLNRIGTDGNGISYSGDSAVIDAKGVMLSSAKDHEEHIETVSLSCSELQAFREKFPVGMDADGFELTL